MIAKARTYRTATGSIGDGDKDGQTGRGSIETSGVRLGRREDGRDERGKDGDERERDRETGEHYCMCVDVSVVCIWGCGRYTCSCSRRRKRIRSVGVTSVV